MNMTDSIKTVLSKYAVFEGRASRPEYWWWSLAICLVGAICGLLGETGTVISGTISVATLIPGLAVGTRRLHDIGKSGWNLLVGLIPLVGFVILILWLAKPSMAGDNQYGPMPRWDGNGKDII